MAAESAEQIAKRLIAENAVQVFSKTTCGYCDLAKSVLSSTGAKFNVTELNKRPDGDAIQRQIGIISGCRTVPQVFINGKFLGGGDDTQAAHRSGKLTKLLKEAGALQ